MKVGDKFDPKIHDAIHSSDKRQEASDKKETGDKKQEKDDKVKKIVLKGYKMGEKVIRPARVVVE